MTILTIDQGTTSTRAFICDTSGTLHLQQQIAHRQILPESGYVEHDPVELLSNVAACLKSTSATHVAIANQGESCLAWDAEDGSPVSPVIVWQDSRTRTVTRQLFRDGTEDEVMLRSGLPLDPYFSATKLGWIMRHIPKARDLARRGKLRLGTTDAFFRDRLTGRFETDIATASRTSLMNLQEGTWDRELCRIFGVPFESLPTITPTAGDLGHIIDGPTLSASIVDQQASLFGHGCHDPGEAKVTFGTGAFVQSVTGRLERPTKPGPLPTVAWQFSGQPVTYALDGAVYTAAAAIDWAGSLGLFAGYDQVTQFDRSPAIDRGLYFLPALAGLACPHWDRNARGAWYGMTLETRAEDMMQALLEGIALRVAEAVGAISGIQPIISLSADGGMARNDYLLGFLAGLLPQRLSRAPELETTALGLAHMVLTSQGQQITSATEQARIIKASTTERSRAQGRLDRFSRVREKLADLARELDEL